MSYQIILVAMLCFFSSCTGQEGKQVTTPVTTDSLRDSSSYTGLMNMDSVDRSRSSISDTVRNIDSLVKAIDSDPTLTTHNFSIIALKKAGHILTYKYKQKNGAIQMVKRQFSYKKDTVVQVFYLQKNRLIYATETITSYFSKDPADTITWAGYFYYFKNKLIHYTTMGHGKSEEEWWKPGDGTMQFLWESLRDIKRSQVKGET